MTESLNINKSKILKFIFISVICFIFYGNSIPNKYAFDDFIVITHNQFTQNGIAGIPDILKFDSWVGCFGKNPKFVEGGRYRPLSLVTFALENQFFGKNPYFSHLINVLLYILTALLLYTLLLKLFGKYLNSNEFFDFPFIAVLLFIIHPIHTEVIDNIKCRDEIMTLAGSLAATIFILKYVDFHKIIYLLYSFICFFLALLSKENAITFLAVIPLSIYFYRKTNILTYIYSLIPLFIATILFLIIRKLALGETAAPHQDFISNALIDASFTQKYATIFYALGLYIKLLVFPHPLTFDYYPNHIPIVNWTNIFAILSFCFYCFILIYALLTIAKRSVISYGILFYLLPLSIVSNLFFPIGGAVITERFIFISSIGFSIIIAWFLSTKVFVLLKSSYLKTSLIAVVMLFCFITTYSRNKVWKDDFSLFTNDVKTSFNSRKSNLGVSVVLLEKANQINDSILARKYRKDALFYANRLVKIFPNYVDAVYRLGNAYSENNMLDSALACYKRTIYLSPDLNNTICDQIPSVLNKSNDVDFKMKYYLEFIKYSPDNFSINFEIGYLSGRYKNDIQNSIYYLTRAVEIQPGNFDANNNLGLAYRLAGKYDKSSIYLKNAVKINPYSLSAWQSLYITYKLAGEKENETEVLKKIDDLQNTGY